MNQTFTGNWLQLGTRHEYCFELDNLSRDRHKEAADSIHTQADGQNVCNFLFLHSRSYSLAETV